MKARDVIIIVDYDDNEIQLKVGSSDLLLWENEGNSSADLKDPKKALMANYNMLHFVATRRKKFSGTLDEFIDTYDIVFPEEGTTSPKGTK